MMKQVICPIFILVLFLATGCSRTPDNKANKEFFALRDGDIIFQTSISSQSKAVQLATGSEYSHMGMIYRVNGELFVYEAVQPVKLTPLRKWIERGMKHHFVVKRLKDADQILTPTILSRMKAVGERFRSRNYDIYFGWSDDRIYCSELVWKIYKEGAGIEIGKLQKLSDFDLANPAVQQKLKERYGNHIPLEEPVISPVSMFRSEKLEIVMKR